MSRLSPSLRALIGAPSARPRPCPAPSGIGDVYAAIARDAARRKVGLRPWLAVSAAATFTLNSPDSLSVLHSVASPPPREVHTAEIIREVGLKCISFNGIPRTINCLNAFRASLPEHIPPQLATKPSRVPTGENVDAFAKRGRALWDSVYNPFEDKLYDKLALAHPDLPVVILHGHYGLLLADPASRPGTAARLGRALTSMVAIACLRAQTGVGPQVLSHVFGLKKAVEDGSYKSQNEKGDAVAAAEEENEDDAVRWLAGDEGLEWILQTVDRISEALGSTVGDAGREAKL